MNLPAVIWVPESTLTSKVAHLPLLDRVVIACHRAGYQPIHILSSTPPGRLPRSTAWGINFTHSPDLPRFPGEALALVGNCLIHPADLRRLKDASVRLTDSAGVMLPALILSAEECAELSDQPADRLLEKGVGRQPIQALEPTFRVSTPAEAHAATRQLWALMRSPSDGLVDRYFNRPIGRFLLSRPLAHTPITPNQISLASIALGLWGAWQFSLGSPMAFVLGALLFQLSAIVDCVDGDIARILYKETSLGKWLDLAGDQVVHVGVFAGIAWGQWRNAGDPATLWLGGATILGAVLSFGVVLRGILSPALSRDPNLQRFIDGATSRDFSVLVLLLACVGRLGWFLWLSAIGSHVFWLTALWLQQRSRRDRSLCGA